MANLIKELLSPYYGIQKVNFRPLTYIEVEQDKLLIIKLNDKYIFKTKLQIADNFIKFNTSKNLILENLNRLNELNDNNTSIDIAKIVCFKTLIRLLYEISKQEYKGFFKKRKYHKFLNKYLFENTEILIDIFSKVLAYNSELKKKLENLLNFDIFKNNASEMTAGGIPLRDLIEINPETGEKSFKH